MTRNLGLNGDREFPKITSTLDDVDMLFIPGMPRGMESEERSQYEQQLIKDARNRGVPILAICAGSWQLWQAFGGGLKDVQDHNSVQNAELKSGWTCWL